jgi:hypothetical protein
MIVTEDTIGCPGPTMEAHVLWPALAVSMLPFWDTAKLHWIGFTPTELGLSGTGSHQRSHWPITFVYQNTRTGAATEDSITAPSIAWLVHASAAI